jgi:hypothetical protein
MKEEIYILILVGIRNAETDAKTIFSYWKK